MFVSPDDSTSSVLPLFFLCVWSPPPPKIEQQFIVNQLNSNLTINNSLSNFLERTCRTSDCSFSCSKSLWVSERWWFNHQLCRCSSGIINVTLWEMKKDPTKARLPQSDRSFCSSSSSFAGLTIKGPVRPSPNTHPQPGVVPFSTHVTVNYRFSQNHVSQLE